MPANVTAMDLFEYVEQVDVHQLLDLQYDIGLEMIVRDTARMEALDAALRRRIAQTLPVGTLLAILVEHDEGGLWAVEVEAVVYPPRGPRVDLLFSPHLPSFFLSVDGAFEALRDRWRLEVQVGTTGYRLKPVVEDEDHD